MCPSGNHLRGGYREREEKDQCKSLKVLHSDIDTVQRERESEGGLQCKLWSSEIHTRAEERERERIKRQQFLKAAYSRPTIEVRLFKSRRRSKKSGKD